MEFTGAVTAKKIVKKYKGFTLQVNDFCIPRGFATALIGENGAGKTTLINILAGTRLDYEAEGLTFFGKYDDRQRDDDPYVRNAIGFTGAGNYYLPSWSVKQVDELNAILFDDYDSDRFWEICTALRIIGSTADSGKKVSALSDGNRTKLMLAGVLARKTELLILDEPASPLDPLMRDVLCEMLRNYITAVEGHTVFFSTHNIADMENITDYAIIMERGEIVEQGFVEELKEKYILVKGEAADTERARRILYTCTASSYGFEGICLAEKLDQLAGMDVTTETPTLSQISVAVLKAHSDIRVV